MTIQYIIDKAQQIEIDRRRVVGQTLSRSQRVKTAERSTSQPFKFKVTPPAQMPWAEARAYIEVIDLNDRANEYEISLNNASGMTYITAYQGDLTTTQINDITILSTGTSTVTLTNLPAVPQSSYILRRGDFIQPENSRYPYTVVNDVIRGISTTTSVLLHRPIITSEGISLINQNLKIGNNVTWRVVVMSLPSYTLIPGRRVQYNGDFELIEKVV